MDVKDKELNIVTGLKVLKKFDNKYATWGITFCEPKKIFLVASQKGRLISINPETFEVIKELKQAKTNFNLQLEFQSIAWRGERIYTGDKKSFFNVWDFDLEKVKEISLKDDYSISKWGTTIQCICVRDDCIIVTCNEMLYVSNSEVDKFSVVDKVEESSEITGMSLLKKKENKDLVVFCGYFGVKLANFRELNPSKAIYFKGSGIGWNYCINSFIDKDEHEKIMFSGSTNQCVFVYNLKGLLERKINGIKDSFTMIVSSLQVFDHFFLFGGDGIMFLVDFYSQVVTEFTKFGKDYLMRLVWIDKMKKILACSGNCNETFFIQLEGKFEVKVDGESPNEEDLKDLNERIGYLFDDYLLENSDFSISMNHKTLEMQMYKVFLLL